MNQVHDVSEGGLFVALMESCFNNELGIDVVASDYKIRKDAYWFGEAQSRVVVSIKPSKVEAFKNLLGDHPFEELGIVTSGSVEVDGIDWGNNPDIGKKNMIQPLKSIYQKPSLKEKVL